MKQKYLIYSFALILLSTSVSYAFSYTNKNAILAKKPAQAKQLTGESRGLLRVINTVDTRAIQFVRAV